MDYSRNWVTVVVSALLRTVYTQSCEETTNLCYSNITNPDSDLVYREIGLNLYSPDKWTALCQQFSKQAVLSCLQDALTSSSCAFAKDREAMIKDSIASTEFKCNNQSLAVYAANWDCFRNQRFERTWSNCQQSLVDKIDAISAAMLSTWDPIRAMELMKQTCTAFQEYFLCTFSTAKVICGPEMGAYMYEQETKQFTNYLLYMNCEMPGDISNLTHCDPQSARLCVTNTKSHIKTLTTSPIVQRMCSEISSVNSSFTECYATSSDGCQSSIKAELDALVPTVTMAIAEVIDLCSQPVLPSEGGCNYNTLKECEMTLLSSLDLHIKELCQLRGSYYGNYSACLMEHLSGCPNVTQRQYTARLTEVRNLWFSDKFNHTCNLEQECVDDFLNRMDEMGACFQSNATKESFEVICNDYQKALTCLEGLIAGCQPVVDSLYREHVLDDLLDTAAFHDCTLKFNGKIIKAPVKACNYRHILQCYSTFFSLVGIKRTNYLPYLHNVSNRFLHTVKKDPQNFCSKINPEEFRRCLDNTLPQCSNFTKEKLGHEINSVIYEDVVYDSNKVISYDFVMDVEYLCTEGCSGIKQLLPAVESCSLKSVSFLTITDNVLAYKYSNFYVNRRAMIHHCGLLRNYTQCVIDKAGSCSFIRHHYLDIHKYVHPDLTRKELLHHCNISMDSACHQSFSSCVHPLLSSVIENNTDMAGVVTSLQGQVVDNQTHLCREITAMDTSKMHKCLTRMLSGCVYGDMDLNRYTDTLTAVDWIKSDMCSQDCNDLKHREGLIRTSCSSVNTRLQQLTDNIKLGILNGQVDEEQCRELKSVADCVSYNAGRCRYLQQLAEKVFLGRTVEAMSICNTQYSTYTGDVTLPTQKTPTQTTVKTSTASSSTGYTVTSCMFVLLSLLMKI